MLTITTQYNQLNSFIRPETKWRRHCRHNKAAYAYVVQER